MKARLRRILRAPFQRRARSPASYDAWAARAPSADRGYPREWDGREERLSGSDARVAAVVHVFYAELLDELIGQLASLPLPFDLIVTNATGVELAIDTAGLPHLARQLVLPVENRGRDLWPLVQVANAGLLDRYELLVKLHTKRSDWREGHAALAGSGAGWRRDLLSALLGDPHDVRAILDAFRDDADLGMVTADGSVAGPEHWGQDREVTAELLRRLDLHLQPEALLFAAGSMYWTRTSVVLRLRDLRMTRDDFEPEDGRIDGTTAHALERVIGLLAADAGLRIVERSHLPVAARGAR